MINSVTLKNFGPIQDFNWKELGKINVIVGQNSVGKTFILKSLFCALRTLEDYKRGNDQRSSSEILTDKLYWTFQPEKIGDLVSKGSDSNLQFALQLDEREFRFSFGKDTVKQIQSIENHVTPRDSNSIFLPAKEVLSLHTVILQSRERDKIFGFDDTYLELARALRQSPKGGKNFEKFAKARVELEELNGGKVEYDENSGSWLFKKGNSRFPIGVIAEGIKKISILDTLLGNRYLTPGSILLIDEPEAALHPNAISKLVEILKLLSDTGIQIFIATHSYFVIKKLYLIANKFELSIPFATFEGTGWITRNLLNEMPDNPIIRESISLYEQEIEMVAK